ALLSALHHEVEACRQEQKEQLAVVGPILLGIDAVVRHIDEIRVHTDARAFSLLNELVQAYRLVTVEQRTVGHQGQQEGWSIASETLVKVFTWQHSCIQESLKKVPNAGDVFSEKTESSAFDIKGLLDVVRQEIAATGMMAIRESAALLELVHVQKEGRYPVPADTQEILEGASGKSEEFSSVVRENISSLQQVLHQEVGRLRYEFSRD
ncbi:MAG: hypothetical protein D3925_10400, partial [Candidatus Electrothrix sp. AR5]|nr:hypothetical protein [Candidatus Electrothrix sp. AR5]